MYRIGFDAKRAFRNFTGLGNYSRTLIDSLSKFYPSNEYLLYTPPYKDHPALSFASQPNVKIITPSGIDAFFHSRWRTKGITDLLNQENPDLYHGLSGELPAGKCKVPMVVTIHDAIFMRFPGHYKAIDRFLYEKKQTYACKKADKIIAISRQTADDAIKFFDADPAKIEVIYQSCDKSFGKSITEDEMRTVKARYSLPDRFILAVGRVEERKNLHNIVRALSLVPNDIKLVSLGRLTPYHKRVVREIEEYGLADRVKFITNGSFADFPAIYKLSEMLVYASLFEGFGIPVLEAVTVGTPVITSAVSSMPEVGGEAVLYTDPLNYLEIAEKINLCLSSPTLREEMVAKGLENARTFSHDKIINQVYDLYKTILK